MAGRISLVSDLVDAYQTRHQIRPARVPMLADVGLLTAIVPLDRIN